MTDAPWQIAAFSSRTDPADLADLRARLRNTRWPDEPEDAGWSLGTDLGYLRELVRYWAEEFDWPAQEAALNGLPRFSAVTEDGSIHFVHARAASGRGLPLLLAHGWPDSFWRYTKLLPLLTDPGAHGADPADAFDVVVPDMPGYGYSARPAGRIPTSKDVARSWARLMADLGYRRYGASGGDIGSSVSRFLALDDTEHVVGVHRTDAGVPRFSGDPATLSETERRWMTDVATWGAQEGAYAAMHRTKPQTAAFGLTDSPAALAAWIVEKLRAWSDCHGDIESRFTKDQILTDVTIYWLTGTIGSSMRMYHANAALPDEEFARFVTTPSAFSLFRADILTPPRAWLERTANVVRVVEHEQGGHFAAFEEPELFAEDLRAFFRPYR